MVPVTAKSQATAKKVKNEQETPVNIEKFASKYQSSLLIRDI